MSEMARTYHTLEQLLEDGHKQVKLLALDATYPQPELSRDSFERQVRGWIPEFLQPYLILDPWGDMVLFPNGTELSDLPPEGCLEAARHAVMLQLPHSCYAVYVYFQAYGGPNKPAQWKPVRFNVSGLEYDACNLPVAVALATGVYPKGREVK